MKKTDDTKSNRFIEKRVLAPVMSLKTNLVDLKNELGNIAYQATVLDMQMKQKAQAITEAENKLGDAINNLCLNEMASKFDLETGEVLQEMSTEEHKAISKSIEERKLKNQELEKV